MLVGKLCIFATTAIYMLGRSLVSYVVQRIPLVFKAQGLLCVL